MSYALVLGVVGGVIGYFAGGNVALGFSVGYSLGASLDAANTKINNEGPRLSDLAVQISSYGASIPILYGTMRFAGNIIWSTDLIETATTASTGGKGSPQVNDKTYSYAASFAVLLCEGPITGIRSIWADNVLIYSIGVDADASTIIASNAFAKSVRVYAGTNTQQPDALIEAAVGIGNCPAYLDEAYVVFEQFQLADYGNRIPQLTFEVVGAGSFGVAHQNICALTSSDPGVTGFRGRSWITDRMIYLWRLSIPLNYGLIDLFQSIDGQEKVSIGRIVLPTSGTYGEPYPVNTRDLFAMEVIEFHDNAAHTATFQSIRMILPFTQGDDGESGISSVVYTSSRTYSSSYDGMGDAYRMTAFDQDSQVLAFAIRSNSSKYFGERISIFRGTTSVANEYVFRTVGAGSFTVCCALTMANDRVYAMIYNAALTRMELHVLLQAGGTLDVMYPGPGFGPSNGADILESLRTDGSSVWAWASGEVWRWNADGSYDLLASDIEGQNDSGGITSLLGGPQCYIGDDHLIMQGEVLMNGDSLNPIFRHQLVHWGASVVTDVPLADIVQAECDRRGVICDVTSLSDDVHGFLITKQMASRSAIEFLASVFRFDAVEEDGVLVFVKRGAAAVRTLTIAADLGAYEFGGESSDPIQMTRQQEEDLPQSVTVNFTDINNAYQAGSIPAHRLNTVSEQTVTLDVSAVGLTADEAAKVADVSIMEAWVNRTRFSWATNYTHADLMPTDVVLLDRGDAIYRVRITKRTDQGGLLQWEGVEDDASILNSAATSSGAYYAGTSISSAPSSDLQLMDIPILRNDDDNAGFYVRAAPMSPGRWRGAVIDQIDNGVVSALGTVTQPNPTGSVLGVLADYVGIESFDESNYVDVQVRGGLSLSSVTRDQALAGANAFLVGREILCARSVALIAGTTGQYRLSGLLRYLRGTNGATHQSGERFVSLGVAGTIRVVNDIGISHQYAAVSFGRSIDSAQVQSFTNQAKGLQTFSPVQLGYGADGLGGLIFTWRRRTRLITAFGDQAPLGEDVEAYKIDIASDGTYASGLTFYSDTQSLHLDAATTAPLPKPFVWRVTQIASGVGTAPPITTPTTTIPGGSGPADTLPNLIFKIDPVAIGDNNAIVDSSATPTTLFISGARVTGGQVYFDGESQIQARDDTKFNLGTKDFSFSFPFQSNQRPGPSPFDASGRASRYLLTRGTTFDGSMSIWMTLSAPGPGYPGGGTQTADSGTIQVYLAGYPGTSTKRVLLQSQPQMNDGRLRTFRFARSSNVFYLIVDGVVVDQVAYTVNITPLTSAPLVFGNLLRPSGVDGWQAYTGAITLKTS